MGTLVELGNIPGYLAEPSGSGPWPALIVIQEWWGLDQQTKSIADRFAAIGYLAFSPDLYHGELAKLGMGKKLLSWSRSMPLPPRRTFKKSSKLSKGIRIVPGKVGSVGFCFGGRMSLALGISRPLDAICTFYGGGMQQLFDQLGSLKSPVLGLFGDKDASIPVGTVEQFDQLLGKIGVHHEVIIYPDSGHAFFAIATRACTNRKLPRMLGPGYKILCKEPNVKMGSCNVLTISQANMVSIWSASCAGQSVQ